jgi:HEAT repeat protein
LLLGAGVKNRIRIRWLVMAVAIAGSILFFIANKSDEPTHNGRTLSYWLERLWHSDESVVVEAEEAIRSMGTNAVPHLIRMLPEREATWKQKYNYRVQKSFGDDWYRAKPLLLGGRSVLAARALRTMGPLAKDAVPYLIQNLTNHLLSASAPSEYDLALSFIGSESVLPLTQVLSHPDKDLRSFAWIALSHSYTNLILAVPELLRLANSPDVETRAHATEVLGHAALATDNPRALSALTERLNDSSETVRFEAERWLAHHTAKTKTALPENGIREER